jgi:hypothetical protein
VSVCQPSLIGDIQVGAFRLPVLKIATVIPLHLSHEECPLRKRLRIEAHTEPEQLADRDRERGEPVLTE